VFWLARELSGRKSIATLAGSLFLAHPLQTQAVTYITQRFESMAALFMVCAAAAYVRYRRTHALYWLGAVLISSVAAGATKETGLVLPVWLVFIEFTFFSRDWLNRRLLYWLPLLLVVAYPAWRTYQQSGPTLTWIPWESYITLQGSVLSKYMQLAAFPVEQFLLYDFQPAAPLSALFVIQWFLVLFAAGAGLWLLRVRPLIGFGILSFFVLLLPVTLLPLPDLIFEHRVYPALCGLAIAAAAAITALPRRWMIGVASVLLLAFGTKTVLRNAQYNDPIAFFEAHREQFPGGAFALVHLGNHYLGMGEVNKALAVTEQARLNESRFNVYYQKVGLTSVATNLGLIHLAKQEYEIAEAEAFRALAVTPGDPLALLLLGNIYLETGRDESAVSTFDKLIRRNPRDPAAWRWYREACLKAGDARAAAVAKRQIDQLTLENERPAFGFRIPEAYRSHVVFSAVFLGMVFALVIAKFLFARLSQPRGDVIA
jgi:tetratricopeptide (TPR) repeat protein